MPLIYWNHGLVDLIFAHRRSLLPSAEMRQLFSNKADDLAMKHHPARLLSWKRTRESCSYWSKASVSRKPKNPCRTSVYLKKPPSPFPPKPLDPSHRSAFTTDFERDAWITFIRCFESQQVADTVCLEEEPHLVVCANDEVGDCGACQAAKINNNK